MHLPFHSDSHSKQQVLSAIRRTFLIPVLRVEIAEQAMCAGDATVLAGHPVIEVTLTTPGALQTIEELSVRYGDDLYVGAGTVLNLDDCRAAISAGARFIVSPSTDTKIIELARESDVVSMPGALTPTEISVAWQAGADLVKIFPAGTMGGPAYLRALQGPFPNVSFVASGGVSTANIAQYRAAGATAICIGESIFERNALRDGRKDAIAENMTRVLELIQQCEPASPSLAL